MHDVGIRCVDLGHVALQLHSTCSASLIKAGATQTETSSQNNMLLVNVWICLMIMISPARTITEALPCFFRSRYVRAATLLSNDFTGKKVVSVVAMFKIEVAIDFYVTKQRISTSWGVCRLLGCSRRAPSAALWLAMVTCIAARNQTFDS